MFWSCQSEEQKKNDALEGIVDSMMESWYRFQRFYRTDYITLNSSGTVKSISSTPVQLTPSGAKKYQTSKKRFYPEFCFSSSPLYEHYTQLVRAESDMLGCGYAHCKVSREQSCKRSFHNHGEGQAYHQDFRLVRAFTFMTQQVLTHSKQTTVLL